MRRTGPLDLVAPFVVAAVVVWVIVRSRYGDLPKFEVYPPVFVALLAVFEIGVSRRIKAAIAHREGSRPVHPIFVARCVALGKASAYAGAVFAGGAAGFFIWAAPKISTVNAVSSDSVSAALLLAAGIALAVAGLLLEQSGVDPGPKDRGDSEQSRTQR